MKKHLWKQGKLFALALALAAGLMALATTEVKAAGSSFQNAETVTFGKRYEIDFTSSDATQYYKFTTDAGRAYYSVNFGKSGGDTKYIKIYEGANTSYGKALDKSRYSAGNDTYTLSLIPNHTYYIALDSYDVGGMSNFTVTKIADDYGNTLGEATAIGLGQTVTGKIEVSDKGEADTFRFTTSSSNSFYEMSLSDTGNSSVYAYIYDGSDESYNSRHIYCSSANTESKVERLERNHTYYVKIYGYWDDATSYKFVVKEIKDDAGDDFSDAAKISNGKTVSKTLQVSDDVDFFKFKTTKKLGAYQFYFKNKSKRSMYVTIYSNNDIASAISDAKDIYISSASTKTIWLNLKKNRTYYIKVSGGDGNASYNLQMKDLKSVVKKTAPSSFKASGYSGWYSRYAYLSWNHKYTNAKYEIYRSTSPNSGFKKIKTLKNASYYYDKSVKRKKTYYYKIRYCVTENGKTCTAKWSKVKRVRIK